MQVQFADGPADSRAQFAGVGWDLVKDELPSPHELEQPRVAREPEPSARTPRNKDSEHKGKHKSRGREASPRGAPAQRSKSTAAADHHDKLVRSEQFTVGKPRAATAQKESSRRPHKHEHKHEQHEDGPRPMTENAKKALKLAEFQAKTEKQRGEFAARKTKERVRELKEELKNIMIEQGLSVNRSSMTKIKQQCEVMYHFL